MVVIVSIVDFIINIRCSVSRQKNCSKAIKRSLKKFPRLRKRVRIIKDWPAFVVVLCGNMSLRGDVTHVRVCVFGCRIDRFQDETYRAFQEEPHGSCRAGIETRKSE